MGARVRRLTTSVEHHGAGRAGWLDRDSSKRLAPIVPVVEYVSTRFEGRLSVSEIAHAVGLHPNYLMHTFKSVMGMPLWEFVIRVRLSYAERLLISTDLSVLEIWLAAGFGSSARFYDSFRRYIGVEPLEFRISRRDRMQLNNPS
jgi:transcriptional regulator GlxA family with amidase domain